MSRLESQYKSLAPSHATLREEVCSVAAGVPLPTPGITYSAAQVCPSPRPLALLSAAQWSRGLE